jgi:hypothetical protein
MLLVNVSSTSNTATATTVSCPAITTNVIYDDLIGSDWSDVSTGSVRNFNNTSPVKAGTKSIRVDYSGNGTLALIKVPQSQALQQLIEGFWGYNTNKNGIKIYS